MATGDGVTAGFRLNWASGCSAILETAEVRVKFNAQGVDVIGSTPEQFAAHLREQSARWVKVVRDAGVTPE